MSRKYRQWIAEYQDPAWSLARHLLGDRAEAEDAVQEAFVKLWHHREAIDPERVRPWLMRVTRNQCLDRLRGRRPEGALEESELSDPRGQGPLEALGQHELGRRLETAIAALAEPYRSLVVLRDLQQYSYEEVAGIVDLSLSQVRVYLHRARRKLRESLAEVKP